MQRVPRSTREKPKWATDEQIKGYLDAASRAYELSHLRAEGGLADEAKMFAGIAAYCAKMAKKKFTDDEWVSLKVGRVRSPAKEVLVDPAWIQEMADGTDNDDGRHNTDFDGIRATSPPEKAPHRPEKELRSDSVENDHYTEFSDTHDGQLLEQALTARQNLEDVWDLTPIPSRTASPEQRMWEEIAVEMALSKLSPQQRACFELRSQGLTHREIANALGYTEKGASSIFSAAKRIIRTEVRPLSDPIVRRYIPREGFVKVSEKMVDWRKLPPKDTQVPVKDILGE